MQALLLCAGLGSRLDPLTRFFPKCLTPINGHPLLGIWLQCLVEAGLRKVFINLHYMPDMVRHYVAQTPYADFVHWLDEPHLLGTAGTLIKCREQLNDSSLLLVHADNLSEFSLPLMWQSHINASPCVSITMMTFDTDCPSSCGIVEHDRAGKIIAFHEKVPNPPGNVANAAVYIVDKRLIDRLDERVSDFSTEVIVSNLANIQTWHNRQYHRDIGTPQSLLQVSMDYHSPLTSPVTDYWYQYWCDNQWHRLYQLAEQLAEQKLMGPQPSGLLTPATLALCENTAAIVVMERFSEALWRECAKKIDNPHSIVLIGAGCAKTVQRVLSANKQRYILLVDPQH